MNERKTIEEEVVELKRRLAGDRLAPGPERGFRRVTFIISVPLFLVGFIAGVVVVVYDPRPSSRSWAQIVYGPIMFGAACGAIPWGIFYVARWAVYLVQWVRRGFRE